MRGHVVRILLLIAATICTVACHVDCVSRRADGSTSGTTCHTALQTQHRQTVTVLRTVAVSAVEPQIGQILQVAGMAEHHSHADVRSAGTTTLA
jgi:hypothetical protein